MSAPAVGLCAACAHARVVESRRGSHFWFCRRSRSDPTFPRYPALPVLSCRGFLPAADLPNPPDALERSPG